MATLIDGRALYGVTLRKFVDWDAGEGHLARFPHLARLNGVAPAPPFSQVDTTKKRAAVAVANWGRWCADCPSCNNAWLVWLEGPHLLYCAFCGNADCRGKWRTVVVPEPDRLATVATLLGLRPGPQHQNWRPPETVDRLVAENLAYGWPTSEPLP